MYSYCDNLPYFLLFLQIIPHLRRSEKVTTPENMQPNKLFINSIATFLCLSFAINMAISQEYAHQIIIAGEEMPQSYDLSVKAAPMPVPPAFAPLMGNWQSTFDEDEVIQFVPGRYITFYDGQKVVEETMNYQEQCPNDCYPGMGVEQSKPIVCFELASQCFAILRIDEDELHIGLAGMEEEGGLIYRRIKE